VCIVVPSYKDNKLSIVRWNVKNYIYIRKRRRALNVIFVAHQ